MHADALLISAIKMEFTVTWCLLLVLLRCRDMRLFLPGTLEQSCSTSCWWHGSIRQHQWYCSGSSKQISRFHYQKNCLPICTARLSPNWQHELEWLQICFCRDISQIMVGVVEVYYSVPLYYLTVLAKKQTRIILGRGWFFIIVLFYLFCKKSNRFVFTIFCWKG